MKQIFAMKKCFFQLNFNNQVNGLLERRNELDQLSNNLEWTKEITYETGLNPKAYELAQEFQIFVTHLLLELGDLENFDNFINYLFIGSNILNVHISTAPLQFFI